MMWDDNDAAALAGFLSGMLVGACLAWLVLLGGRF